MGKKKALIVGISNYGDRLPRLDSPEREIEEWRDLLMDEYDFSCGDIRLLANDRARRDEIVHRLKWLFADAEKGDQLVFAFAGHGIRLQRRDGTSGELLDGLDEALVAYPSAATDDLEKMAIFDNEVFNLYAESSAPEATVTFILDCCHGGGFNSADMPRQPRAMSVSLPVDLRHRSLTSSPAPTCWNTRGRRSARRTTMPVILSAAGELNLSVEVDLEGERRSVFSYHALKALRGNPMITYQDLVDEIRDPIDDYYPQHTNLRGDEMRRAKPFLH